MFPATFETDRLRFERFCRDTVDALELYDLVSRRNPTIEEETRYLPWDPAETVNDAADRLDAFERQWDERERAEWVIVLKAGEEGSGRADSGEGESKMGSSEEKRADEIAGSAGIICEWEKDLAVLAIWLRKPFWGRGYAGERADALLEIAFDELDFGVVAIVLHSENDRSYRAVEKYVQRHGGRYEGLLRNHAGRYDEPVDHHRFSISREEYEASK